MSDLNDTDAVSALPGARYAGFALVEEAGMQGMITLRGDLGSKPFAAAVKKVTGLALPGRRERVGNGKLALVWMSPDELLLLCLHGEAEDKVAALEAAFGDAFALAVNVSDARAMFRVTGAGAREVIAKLMPVDMVRFEIGEVRRSRLAQVPAAIWMTGEDTVEIVCFRSVARYVFDLLALSAAPGSEVGALA